MWKRSASSGIRSRNMWPAVGKPCRSNNFRRAGGAGFAIEDLEAVDVGGAVFDGGHGTPPFDHRLSTSCGVLRPNCCEGLADASSHDDGRRGDDRRVIDGMGTRPCAFMRSAMKRCVSETIMRSCSATRNQVGRSFHSGPPAQDGHAGEARAAAAPPRARPSSSADAFCAKAAGKASSGSQIRPVRCPARAWAPADAASAR